jgi:hypothetical protein
LISSVPAGAEVWRAGERLGITPYTLRWDGAAAPEVELRLDGYQSQTLAPANFAGGDQLVRLKALSSSGRPKAPKAPATGDDDIRTER